MSSEDETPESATMPYLDANPQDGSSDDDSLEFVDAMILGDASINPDEFDMIEGTNVNSRGQTNSFLLYTSGATTRGLSLESVPKQNPEISIQNFPLTPYERFVLEIIDGQKDVLAIQESAGLDRQEVMTTLLTLLDKSLISFEATATQVRERMPSGRPVRIDRKVSVLEEDFRPPRIPDADTLATASSEVYGEQSTPNTPDTSMAKIIGDTLELDGELARALTSRRKIAPEPDIEGRQAESSTDDLETHHGPDKLDVPDETQANEIIANPDWNRQDRIRTLEPEPLEPEPLEPEPLEPEPLEPEPLEPEEANVSPRPSIPAAVTELSEEYLQMIPSNTGSTSEYDFGEEEAELSLSLGLSEEAELSLSHGHSEEAEDYSDLELHRPFSELDLQLDDDSGDSTSLDPPSAIRPANSDLLNDAVAFAMNELADELSEAEEHRRPEFSLDDEEDEEELELSDAFLSLENKLGSVKPPKAKTPAPRKPSIKLQPIDPVEVPVRLGSQFIKALPENNKAPTPPRPSKFVKPRGLIKEVDRRKSPGTKKQPDAKTPQHRLQANRPKKTGRAGPTGAGLARADRLFQEALADKAAGNFVSARMNIKLALSFDPQNPVYTETLEKLLQEIPSKVQRPSQAMEYYQQATQAEKQGQVDEAIDFLYKALGFAKDPPIYNRLGVLLAMKKMEFAEARKMIETAISLEPSNATYQHNLKKVLAMQASLDVDTRNAKPKAKKGLLGFLSRRKKS